MHSSLLNCFYLFACYSSISLFFYLGVFLFLSPVDTFVESVVCALLDKWVDFFIILFVWLFSLIHLYYAAFSFFLPAHFSSVIVHRVEVSKLFVDGLLSIIFRWDAALKIAAVVAVAGRTFILFDTKLSSCIFHPIPWQGHIDKQRKTTLARLPVANRPLTIILHHYRNR